MTASYTNVTCLSGSEPSLLPLVRDANGRVTCLQGFYCPGLQPTNRTTWPVACIPEPECAQTRVFGGNCDEAQHPYEPRLCEKGHYCPTPQQQLPCPSGSFCIKGAFEPQSCPAMSICPEESVTPREYGPLIFLVLILAGIAILRKLYVSKWRLRGQEPGKDAEVAANAGSVRLDGAFEVELHDTALSRQFRAVSEGQAPIRLDFSDLHVETPPTPEHPQGKVLLEGVSGSLKPGTVTAVMGPSGAGKTVLLTTLLQRLDPSWKVGGSMLVNKGQGKFSDLRSFIGFVPQDDVLHNELTVEANLYYASELRLPKEWPAERRHQMREVVMDALGLLPHRTSVIGTEAERGISGGQRKRASIGVELASAPLMLFLDEPTSGLDSTTSLELVRALKSIAVAARITIMMVIHQPRVEIWNALDEVLILGVGGRTVFKGSQKEVQPYFAAQGVEFDPKFNPADVIMDAIVGNTASWVARWKECEEDLETAEPTPLMLTPNAAATFIGAGPPRQYALFVLRSLEKQLSDVTPFVVEVIVIFLCGAVLGNSMAGFTLDADYRSPYEPITPITFKKLLPQLHMYQLMSLGLAAAVAGVSVFGSERTQYFREVPTGLNRLAYFLANVTAAVPRVCVVSLVYAAVFTILAALPVPFAFLYFAVVLSYWSIYGLGACISVTVSRQSAALVASTGSVCLAVFNGFIDFPVFLKRLTPGFYASQILQQQHARWIRHWSSDAMAGSATGYAYDRVSESFGLMVVLGVVLHAIAFILMIVTHRDKQR